MREHYRSLVIGIPTFDRRVFVEETARSIAAARLDGGTEVTLLVVDDASSEYDEAFLRAIFPAGTEVVRREANSGGADFACRDLLGRCLALQTDAVLILDSDMLVGVGFVAAGLALLPRTDGCLSLFNTPNHPVLDRFDGLVTKATVGATGTLWDRDLAAEIHAAIGAGESWDWRFSHHLTETGRRIFVCERSLVQHLGFYAGQNSRPWSGDFGVGFPVETNETIGVLIEHAVRGQGLLGARLLELGEEARRQRDRIAALEARIEDLETFEFSTVLRRLFRHLLRRIGA